MLKVLARPMRVRTQGGTIVARFAMVPAREDEPWWVVYRDECGRWFTTMLEGAELSP
ncbi:MAG: hypothetical protein JWR10_4240 [Rubritepida sp.]|nr:hypothetical protein [Rubritepida sp.]